MIQQIQFATTSRIKISQNRKIYAMLQYLVERNHGPPVATHLSGVGPLTNVTATTPIRAPIPVKCTRQLYSRRRI